MTEGIRTRMDNWRFWIAVAYFGLVLVVVGLFVLFTRQTHEDAAHSAYVRSSSIAQVQQCFAQVKTAPVIKGFVKSHEALVENSLISTRAILRLGVNGNETLYQIRQNALNRLLLAQKNARQLSRLVLKTTPTKRKCDKLASTLNVPIQLVQSIKN